MNVWAISDLHLSFARPDRRERYAARWRDHAGRIEEHWRERVGRGDLVLLPGDLSMARNHRDLQPDLVWLDRLPGTKVLAPGNHDQWWNAVAAIRPMLRASLLAVDGDALESNGAIVCGLAGVPAVSEPGSTDARETIQRALESLRISLQEAARLRARADAPLYVLWHYPPFDAHGTPGPWVELFEQSGVTACVYGHLHSQKEWSAAVQGLRGGVRYYCVAADAVGFCPLRIDTIAAID
jgi:predicted phosphohydrolase